MPTINYKAAMPNGMNRDWRARANIPFFELVKGLQSVETGLKSYVPFTVVGTPAYPWPQVIHGKRVRLAFYETSVYDIVGAASLSLYDFSTYNQDTDAASAGTIASGGGEWHFMDNYTTWMAFNGQCVVFKAGFSSKVFVSTVTNIESGCNLIEGRAMIGGFTSSDAIWTDLATLFEAAETQLPDQLKGVYAGMDATWAFWTSIGGPELLGLLDINFLKYGWFDDTKNTGLDDDNTLLLKLLQRGEFGARPLLHNTTVLKCLPMGAFCIAYQSAGVNALWPYDSPLPTYGIVNPQTGTVGLRNMPAWIGPLGRGCVGGDSDAHLMLTSDNDLFLLEREGFKASYVQASHLLSSLLPATVRISLDPLHRDFYICGKDSGGDLLSFCYSHTDGLTRCPKATSSISMFGGITGPFEASIDAAAIVVTTMPFNAAHPQVNLPLGTVGVVKAVRISSMRGNSTDGWKCVVYYRLTITDTWTAATAVSFDDRGVANVDIPGIEWKVSVTHDDNTKTLGLDELLIDLDFGGKFPGRQWINASDPSVMAVPTP
jgi:hypothetical protein